MNRLIILFALCFSISCDPDTGSDAIVSTGTKVFSEISADKSGLSFNNHVQETQEINYYKYVYLYNGGGVGICDINNDGLSDVYFTATMGTDKLFLNKGNLEFEDISGTAGINKYGGHKTGVNFIDINNDGWNDIYVCRSGWTKNPNDLTNLLFINNKDNTFTESGQSYGIADASYSVQSVFADFDKDGDNDLFISTHPEKFKQPLDEMIDRIKNPTVKDSDQYYTNNGDGTFTNATVKSGIANYGYGLGLAAADMNNDGYTDLYISNDFAPHDYYYVNNGDGTFTESLQEYFPHCSYFSMGNDVVDINNDGFLDLFVVEMLSEDNVRQKTNMAPMDMDRFTYQVDNGLYYQYMRNSFHINNGNGHFSDIAHYSGIDKTDWSWATLFGDYDNDGDNDLLVANGYLKDTQDKDFAKKSNKVAAQNNNQLTFNQISDLLKSTPLANYAFEYKGEYKFENVSDKWGFNFSGYSNGMASGDLDNDGDLDIIVSNINADASLYINNTNNKNNVRIQLAGPPQNKQGLNSKLWLYTDKGYQYKEFQTSRGFQSSVDPVIHFGLQKNETIQKLEIEWANGETQSVSNLESGNVNKVSYQPTQIKATWQQPSALFVENTKASGLNFTHKEQIVDDYKTQVLLPHKLSQLGPAIAKSDIDDNGFEDIYIGGANGQAGEIWIQNANNVFTKSNQQAFKRDKNFEDVAAHFFDADNDGDQDLYVVSGSYEFENGENLQDRLYINQGNGNYIKDTDKLPQINSGGACVASHDFDNDGDNDLFVGGRSLKGKYPSSPQSYFLVNENGRFTDQTKGILPELSKAGMITSAVWSDYNNDGDKDLIIVGEWSDIQFYKNENGTLSLDKPLSKNIGWWNCIKAVDIDNDGDDDYVVGNLGQNYKYTASENEPFEIYAGDFDDNNVQDIVLSYRHDDDNLYPVRGFQCSSEQLPELQNKFDSYESFGQADVYQVYGDDLDDALNIKANNFNSVIIWNTSTGLKLESLPPVAQMAPIQDIVFEDIDNNGYQDIIAAGNWYMSEIETPRADNGSGIVLLNNGDQSFNAQEHSGFFAKHDVRRLVKLKSEDKSVFVVGNNNSAVQVFVPAKF